jgi:guanylate kinase
MSNRRGQLFIVSAPSGAGKTTLVERLVQQVSGLKMSRSYTSRTMRAGETDGVDYNFIERRRFDEMIAAGEFLEWADVFGNLYGSSLKDTEHVLASGEDLAPFIEVEQFRERLAKQTMDPASSELESNSAVELSQQVGRWPFGELLF